MTSRLADSRFPVLVRSVITVCCALVLVSVASVSAHVVKGLIAPDLATAFVSSPSAGDDAPVPLTWGTTDTGITVVCFNVANTSTPRLDPDWPRITGVGFELPGSLSGFSLIAPLTDEWELVEDAEAKLPGHREVTLDLAIVAQANPKGRRPGRPHRPLGIPPGQQGIRGAGTRFCVSGPFPDRLPDLSTPIPDDTVATTIEGLINGVVVGFHGVAGGHRGLDAGVWFPSPGVEPRVIPLFP